MGGVRAAQILEEPMERITEEDGAAAYAEMTDSTRRLVRAARDIARQCQRVIDADQATEEAEEREARRESKGTRKR